MIECARCSKRLTGDEIGLYRKLFGRGAERGFICIDCCAEYLSVPREMLEKKIELWKSMGCTLFV